ncbi:MAG TPA: hypothetical protein ENH82_10750 [bacterium]|nr:hypothetical protein [bacterium]
MAKYAKDTTVTIEKSKIQIQKLFIDWGITEFFFGTSIRGDGIGFQYNGRTYKWNIIIPKEKHLTDNQQRARGRQRWRILYMSLKMKLEEVSSGAETFEDQFLAKMCLPNGNTVADFMKLPENVAKLAESKMPSLLTGEIQ